jgi:hypothetical protein
MWKWLLGFGIPVFVLLAWLWLRSGPRGPVPTVDPIIRWNAEHARLEDNAADLYREAFDRLVGKEDSAWQRSDRRPSDPVPPEAAAWVEQNQDALELARLAAERRNCWFVLERTTNTDFSPSHLPQMRILAKLLHWRALIAAHDHDAVALADAAVAADRIARHVDEGSPILLNALVGIAIRALACNEVTWPMLWPEFSAAERAKYLKRLEPIFDPSPPLGKVFAGEQELYAWMYAAVTPTWQQTLMAAPDRVAGELERCFRPLRDLAALPVERQCDPEDPLVVQVRALENEPASMLNVPSLFSRMVFPSLSRALTIRVHLITDQRGARTVLELYAYRDRTGAWPDSLEALAGDFEIDPFSGQPFVYRRTDDGFTLYSVGFDRKDNGGRHDPRMGEDRTDSDYVFWPIPEPQATSAPAPQPDQPPK